MRSYCSIHICVKYFYRYTKPILSKRSSTLSRNRRNTYKSQGQEYEMLIPQQKPTKGAKKHPELDNVFSFKTFVEQRKAVSLYAKSDKQREYIDLLTNSEKKIVFATGPAGTGKTMLAVLAAIKALKNGEVKKIIITRPAVGVDDEKHGFLPGTLLEKLLPWATPIIDIFKEYYSPVDLKRMLEEETIELAALSLLRGRTFKNSYIVVDEAQNTSMNSMKMVLTRIGENSKMVITGDLNQHDKPFLKDNGFKDFTERLSRADSDTICMVNFTGKDIQRHPVVEEVLKLYGEI